MRDLTALRGEWRVGKPVGCWAHSSDEGTTCQSMRQQYRYMTSHLVNIVSDHSREVILLAEPVLLDLHFPAALDDRVSCQFTHVCGDGVSRFYRILDRNTHLQA
jgi:hypothetical protein